MYVAVLKEVNYDFAEELSRTDLIVLGIGELYRTKEDAENQSFG